MGFLWNHLTFGKSACIKISNTVMFLFFLCLSCRTTVFLPLDQVTSGETFSETGEYILGAGDRVALRVYGNTQSLPVDGEFTISPSGDLGLPLAGFVGATGLTLSELNEQITLQLKPFIKDPKVSLSVISQASFQVFFDGEVGRPGPVQVTPGTNILQGLSLAGGQGRFSNSKFMLLRKVRGGLVKRFSGDLDNLLEGEKNSDKLLLERYDYLYLY